MDWGDILKTLLAGGFLTSFLKMVKETMNAQDVRRQTDKILLREVLKRNITEENKKGFTTLHKHQEITESYGLYRDLGGNGTIESLYNKYNTLEIKGD